MVVGLMQQALDRAGEDILDRLSRARVRRDRRSRETAERLGTEHQEFRVEPECIDLLEKLVWHYDEPFADSSAIPTYYVSQLTRQHVTVALTGDGGDELFAGYLRYRRCSWLRFDRLPALHARAPPAIGCWQRLSSGRRQRRCVRRAGRFAEALALSPQRRYFDWMSMFNESRRAELYSDAFLAELPDADPFAFLARAFARVRGRDPVTQASLADLVTYLPCDLMTKVDIASMANGLECRAPFLDHRVVELAAECRSAANCAAVVASAILREAFGDLLPPSRSCAGPRWALACRWSIGFGTN